MQQAQFEIAAAVKDRGHASWPIYLVLDSPGGDVEAGMQFIEFAKTIENLKTISIFAASMASGIVEALPGTRYVTGNGVLMFHRATIQLQGQVSDGEFDSRLAWIKDQLFKLETSNAERLQLSLPDYKAKIKDELWLLAEKAIKQHGADSMIDITCSTELIDRRVETQNCSFFGCVTLAYSGCPTFRIPVAAKAG